jgi:hypothetical protein
MPFASNNNAVLIDACKNLQNLSVLLEVTEDIATTAGTGWSFQLNCYPPVGEYCQASRLNWLQYIVVVQGGRLSAYIQYWAAGVGAWPSGYTPLPGTSPWLPCWSHDYGLTTPFGTITDDTLPRESTLQIALATDSFSGVTSATFTYTDPDGNEHPYVFQAPEIAVHPIVAAELNLVGPPGGSAEFTQGLAASRGVIYYSVSDGRLSVQNGGAGSACGEAAVFTAETSNMSYSDIDDAPGATVTQILQQPVSCAIEGIVGGNQGALGEMRRIRGEQVAGHPAGQWLIEVLDRHAADLALLAGSEEADLARPARDLLTEATRTIREGRAFDDATVDAALTLLGRLAGKLPPSMLGVAPAGVTMLESLRGRTLEEGLRTAGQTILPRSSTPR